MFKNFKLDTLMDKAIFIGLVDNPPKGIDIEIDAKLYLSSAQDLNKALTTLGPKELSEAKLFKTNAALELAHGHILAAQIQQRRASLFPELEALLERVSRKEI